MTEISIDIESRAVKEYIKQNLEDFMSFLSIVHPDSIRGFIDDADDFDPKEWGD